MKCELDLPLLRHFLPSVPHLGATFRKERCRGLTGQVSLAQYDPLADSPEVIALILRMREDRCYGAVGIGLYLQRHYPVYISPTTFPKILRRHHVGRASLKRSRPAPKRQTEGPPVPGSAIQVNAKFIPSLGRAGQRFYQFTTIDKATRFRVLRPSD